MCKCFSCLSALSLRVLDELGVLLQAYCLQKLSNGFHRGGISIRQLSQHRSLVSSRTQQCRCDPLWFETGSRVSQDWVRPLLKPEALAREANVSLQVSDKISYPASVAHRGKYLFTLEGPVEVTDQELISYLFHESRAKESHRIHGSKALKVKANQSMTQKH